MCFFNSLSCSRIGRRRGSGVHPGGRRRWDFSSEKNVTDDRLSSRHHQYGESWRNLCTVARVGICLLCWLGVWMLIYLYLVVRVSATCAYIYIQTFEAMFVVSCCIRSLSYMGINLIGRSNMLLRVNSCAWFHLYHVVGFYDGILDYLLPCG